MIYIKSIELPVDNLYRKIPIFAKQSDYNSRYFSVKLTKKGAVLTADAFGTINEVAIGITRGDKQKKAFKGEYNSASNTFTLPLPKWAVKNAGDKLSCDVMVIGTNESGEAYILRSALMEVYVQPAGYGSEDVSEDESVEILTGLIADVVKLETDVRTAEEARKVAEAERVTEYDALSEKLNSSLDNINAAAENAEEVNDLYGRTTELVAGLTNSLDQIEKNTADIQSNAAKIHNLTQVLLENKQMDFVTVEHAYTARQTADGEDIVDYNGEGQYTYPTKIQGDTVKCYSMIDFSGAKSQFGLTVTANGNTLTVTGTPEYSYAHVLQLDITDLLEDGKTYNLYQSVAFNSSASSGAFFMQVNITNASTGVITGVNSANGTGKKSFACDKTTYSSYVLRLQTGLTENVGTIKSTISFMFYEGTEEKPYQPYFTDLKNAYFEKIVSTGRNVLNDSPFLNKALGTELVSYQMPFKVSAGTYTCMVKTKNNTDITNNVCEISIRGRNKEMLVSCLGKTLNAVNAVSTFTVTEDMAVNSAYLYFYFNSTNGANYVGAEIEYIKIIRGEVFIEDEPYTESEFTLTEPVQLGKWDYISPQTGEVVRGTGKVEFTGTENFQNTAYDEGLNSCYLAYTLTGKQHLSVNTRGNGICNLFAEPTNDVFTTWRNATVDSFKVQNGSIYLIFIGKTVDEAKSYLAELYAAGTPLIVEYELAEPTTETIACPTNYLAKKDGMETIKQGNTDNSEYGAENTVTQDYIITIGGTGDE